MKPQSVHHFQEWFEALQTTDQSQVAMMRLEAGAESGPAEEQHPQSDQILLVLEGTLKGTLRGEPVTLQKGEFITIPAGVPHRFFNDSTTSSLTFNVYAPPAYPPDTRG